MIGWLQLLFTCVYGTPPSTRDCKSYLCPPLFLIIYVLCRSFQHTWFIGCLMKTFHHYVKCSMLHLKKSSPSSWPIQPISLISAPAHGSLSCSPHSVDRDPFSSAPLECLHLWIRCCHISGKLIGSGCQRTVSVSGHPPKSSSQLEKH